MGNVTLDKEKLELIKKVQAAARKVLALNGGHDIKFVRDRAEESKPNKND